MTKDKNLEKRNEISSETHRINFTTFEHFGANSYFQWL